MMSGRQRLTNTALLATTSTVTNVWLNGSTEAAHTWSRVQITQGTFHFKYFSIRLFRVRARIRVSVSMNYIFR